MSFHGNSKLNDNPHHLYEIFDKEEDTVFKYGISTEPIGKDGLCKRMRLQLKMMNLVAGWKRFTVQILLFDIPDRIQAREIEDEHINAYRIKFGQKPKGNLR
jgi:URI fold toxin 2